MQKPHGSTMADGEDGEVESSLVVLLGRLEKEDVKSVSRSSDGSGFMRLEIESL